MSNIHPNTQERAQEEDHIWTIGSEGMDQKQLDSEEGARGLNPSIVYRRVDFLKYRNHQSHPSS
jgi:hypothetical protein